MYIYIYTYTLAALVKREGKSELEGLVLNVLLGQITFGKARHNKESDVLTCLLAFLKFRMCSVHVYHRRPMGRATGHQLLGFLDPQYGLGGECRQSNNP